MTSGILDIQFGSRWSSAPEFSFGPSGRRRAVSAAHAITAPLDLIYGHQLVSDELPPQPFLTTVWRLALAVRSLRNRSAAIARVPLLGSSDGLSMWLEGENICLRLTLPDGSERDVRGDAESFINLVERRIGEVVVVTERLQFSPTRWEFLRRIGEAQAVAKQSLPPGTFGDHHTKPSALIDCRTDYGAGNSLYSCLAATTWERAHREPSEWYGELVFSRPGHPDISYVGDLARALFDILREADVETARVALGKREPALARLLADVRSRDEARVLYEHCQTLLDDAARASGRDNAETLRYFAEQAGERGATLANSIDATFATRMRDFESLLTRGRSSDESTAHEHGGISLLRPGDMRPREPAPAARHAHPSDVRPFEASEMRSLNLVRDWTAAVHLIRAPEFVGASPSAIVLADEENLVRVDLTTGSLQSSLQATRGNPLEYEVSAGALRVTGGERMWSIAPGTTAPVEWPIHRTDQVAWWSHGANGWVHIAVPEDEVMHIAGRGETFAEFHLAVSEEPLSAAGAEVLTYQEALGLRLRRAAVAEGSLEPVWLLPTSVRPMEISFDQRFVAWLEPADSRIRARWVDRETGATVWSTDLPEGQASIMRSSRGLIAYSCTDEGLLHGLSLDATTGRPDFFCHVDFGSPIARVEAAGDGLFVQTDQFTAGLPLIGRVHEPRWILPHERGGSGSYPRDAIRWDFSGDVMLLVGESLEVFAAETGETLFEVDAFWEELVYFEVDDALNIVVVERRGDDDLHIVHRLHCRGFLAPVRQQQR